jgi:UDP-3-O-[3-hydroxymyristoyl] glucosamine N-acyltransferase
MSYNLAKLAETIIQKTGEKVEVKGDSSFVPNRIQTLENAEASSITFLANPKYAKMLTSANAGAVILNSASSEEWSGNALVMDNPYLGFAIVAQLLDTTPKQAKSVHASAVIAENVELPSSVAIGANAVIEQGVKLGENVEIGAGCYIGQGTIVGSGTKIWPNVTVYHGVTLGENCAIHAHTVIGADGFGYAPQKLSGDQHWHKIPQVGGVVIGDGTEIGASTTIDRGAIDDTIIGRGVIIDNQIQIGHNVNIGDFTAVAASTAIAGSTTIGKNVTIGGHCSIAGHLNIVDSAFITGRTFVISDIKEAGVYSSGMPASTNKEWRNNTARYRKLTELFTRVKNIEKKLGSE